MVRNVRFYVLQRLLRFLFNNNNKNENVFIYQIQQNKIYLTNVITSYIDINHGDYVKAYLAAITWSSEEK